MAKRTTRSANPKPPKDPAAGDAPARVKPASDRATDKRAGGKERAPSDDEIRMRAYHRYLERGASGGLEFDDWLEAERELRNKK
jgi:hypothetical protein